MQTYKRAHYWLGFCICIMEPVVHYKHCLFHRGLLNQWLKLCRLQREIKILQCKCVSILLCYDMIAGCWSSKTLFSQAGNLQAFEISTTHLKRWHFCWQIPGIFLVLFIFFFFFFNLVAYSLEKKQRKICRLVCSVYCKHTMCMICPVSSSSSSSSSKDSIQLWAENKHSRHWTQSTSLTVNEMWMKTRHFLGSYLHLRHFLFCLVSLTVASHTSFK